MPRAVASVLMRLLGHAGLWALPGAGADTPQEGHPCWHSQLNLPLLKLLQDRPPLGGPQAGGELGHRHTPKGLDEQEEPGWETPVSRAGACQSLLALRTPTRRASPVGVLAGVGEAENPREVHVQDEVQDDQGLGTQAAGHVVVLRAQQSWPGPGAGCSPPPPPCTPLTVSPTGKVYFPPESTSSPVSLGPPRASPVEKSRGW